MDDHRRLQKEVMERNSALFNQDEISLDDALAERYSIDDIEDKLLFVDEILINTADLGFFGFMHPGGLTELFYGYRTTPCPPPTGHQT